MAQMELNRAKLKSERKSRNISQEKLAEKIGGSVRNIRYIENGTTTPSCETLRKICGVLELTVESVCVLVEESNE